MIHTIYLKQLSQHLISDIPELQYTRIKLGCRTQGKRIIIHIYVTYDQSRGKDEIASNVFVSLTILLNLEAIAYRKQMDQNFGISYI